MTAKHVIYICGTCEQRPSVVRTDGTVEGACRPCMRAHDALSTYWRRALGTPIMATRHRRTWLQSIRVAV